MFGRLFLTHHGQESRKLPTNIVRWDRSVSTWLIWRGSKATILIQRGSKMFKLILLDCMMAYDNSFLHFFTPHDGSRNQQVLWLFEPMLPKWIGEIQLKVNGFHEKYYQHLSNVMFIKRALIQRRSTKINLSRWQVNCVTLQGTSHISHRKGKLENHDSKESAGRGYGTVPSKVSLCVCKQYCWWLKS